LKEQWCIPPKASAAFVCAMENVLTVYQRPLDSAYPVVCVDETSKQLVKETRLPLTMKPGQVERYDYEYERNGTANLFMLFAPFIGWRCVKITDRRTKQDWAQVIKDLVDVHFPEAQRITVIQDNLNTHTPEALYETFEPNQARRILDKLEFVYTPKHGSWLNMAEIEFSSLAKQCLDISMPDKPFLETQTSAWTSQRNSLGACTHWRFTTQDARVKLAKLYPSL
jgi:DDE superfamily endonuclease